MGQALSIEDFEDFHGIRNRHINKNELEVINKLYQFTYIFSIILFFILFYFFYNFNI